MTEETKETPKHKQKKGKGLKFVHRNSKEH